jgi:hypothetical protein
MRIPTRRRPAARELEGVTTDGNSAFPDVHRWATAGRVTDTYPWSPPPWRGPARRVDDPRLNHAERRICSELGRHPRQDVVLRETGIIVEEEQQVSLNQAHSGIATGGNAQILGQRFGLDAIRQTGRSPAIADHDHIKVHITLAQQTDQTTIKIIRPFAHRQDDDPELGAHWVCHRSLEEVSTAIR